MPRESSTDTILTSFPIVYFMISEKWFWLSAAHTREFEKENVVFRLCVLTQLQKVSAAQYLPLIQYQSLDLSFGDYMNEATISLTNLTRFCYVVIKDMLYIKCLCTVWDSAKETEGQGK